MKRAVVCVYFFLVVLGGWPAAAGAQSSDQSRQKVDNKLEAMMRRLEAQQAEMERLRAELEALRQQVRMEGSATGGVPAREPAAAAGAEASAAIRMEAQQHTAGDDPRLMLGDRVKLGGYGSFRFEVNDVGGNQFVPGGSAKAFTFRRFVLTTEAKLSERLRVYSETEFERLLEIELEKGVRRRAAGGLEFFSETEGNSQAEIAVEQMWVEYSLGKNQFLRGGIVLPPLGRFNILHDDDYWDLPRRTLVDRDAPVLPVASAWREAGAGLVGSVNIGDTGKLSYQTYVTTGSTLDFNLESVVESRLGDTSKLEVEAELAPGMGGVDGTRNVSAVSWRVAYSPTLAGEIAFSGYHSEYTPSYLPLDSWVHALGLDWKWRFRQFEWEGETIYSGFQNSGRVARSLAQVALESESEGEIGDVETELAIKLGGLARTRVGFWSDFKYHWRPQWLRRSFLGREFEDPQLIPILRYERVWLLGDIDGLDFSGGVVTSLSRMTREQGRLSLGVNYRPMQQVGFQVAYEHNRRHQGSGLIFPRVSQRTANGLLLGITVGF